MYNITFKNDKSDYENICSACIFQMGFYNWWSDAKPTSIIERWRHILKKDKKL